jgi:hypothetical protein
MKRFGRSRSIVASVAGAMALGLIVGMAPAASACGVSSCQPPPCTAPKVNFRWHYATDNTSGSWSATQTQYCGTTFSMGPQSMEGDLKIAPGAHLSGGYDFTMPGNNQSRTLTVNNAKLTFNNVHCVSGAAPSLSSFTLYMTTPQTYTFNNSQWQPSGDQHSVYVYQGETHVPNLCNGGNLRLDKGATFSATLS